MLSKSQTHRRRADNKQNFELLVIGSFFDDKYNLPRDGKRKKAVVQRRIFRAHSYTVAFEKIEAAVSFLSSQEMTWYHC